jgi:hypothetical protein
MRHHANTLDPEPHLVEKISEKERSPGVKVMIRVGTRPPLRSPVVDWKPKNELPTRPQDSVKIGQLLGGIYRVLKRMVRNHNICNTVVHRASVFDDAQSALGSRLSSRSVRFNTDLLVAGQRIQDAPVTTSEINDNVRFPHVRKKLSNIEPGPEAADWALVVEVCFAEPAPVVLSHFCWSRHRMERVADLPHH